MGALKGFHIYSHSREDETHFPQVEVWDELLKSLKRAQRDLQFQIHLFVLMSNHYHLLVSFDLASPQRLMNFLLKLDLAKDLWPRGWAAESHPFGSKEIFHPKQYRQVFRYIARNPLDSGLSNLVEEYPYSTLYLNGSIPFSITVHPWARESVMDIALNYKLDLLNFAYLIDSKQIGAMP